MLLRLPPERPDGEPPDRLADAFDPPDRLADALDRLAELRLEAAFDELAPLDDFARLEEPLERAVLLRARLPPLR